MGLYAAKSAILVAARLKLGNTAARLLLHMALECWDEKRGEQEPRRYFGGRELSAIALGFLAPGNGSAAAYRAVKRAIHELIDSGAITRLRTGGRGLTSEYELMLDSSRPAAAYRPSNDPNVLPFTGGQGATDLYPQRASF
ncbi:hypothetical protein [Frigoribacterium sp. CG_9.8]|uniref:hypothetical protein n=1 Tax=Frigoribacterium sp. CG_9.8 TaxID=2787733 RepID=UPI0018CA478C|nr:hypothetical protein [Frigoribacterium sp. CG_9.8]